MKLDTLFEFDYTGRVLPSNLQRVIDEFTEIYSDFQMHVTKRQMVTFDNQKEWQYELDLSASNKDTPEENQAHAERRAAQLRRVFKHNAFDVEKVDPDLAQLVQINVRSK